MSRSTAIAISAGLAVLLVAFVVIAVATGDIEWVLWSAVPILGVLGFFVAGIRGETLGEQKRARDARLAERKAAERKARVAARAAGD